jgi:hypothetical protein
MVIFEVRMRLDQGGPALLTKLCQAHVTEPRIGPLSA